MQHRCGPPIGTSGAQCASPQSIPDAWKALWSGACAQNSNLVGVLFGAGVRVGSYCGKLDEVVRGPGAVVGVRVWVVYGPGRCRFTEIQPFEFFFVQTQGCQEVQSDKLARTGRPLLASKRKLATVTHLLATLGLTFGGPPPLGRCS